MLRYLWILSSLINVKLAKNYYVKEHQHMDLVINLDLLRFKDHA